MTDTRADRASSVHPDAADSALAEADSTPSPTPDRLSIRDLLEQLLVVAARMEALHATSADLRAELVARAKATIAEEGVVPTWRVPELGTIPVSKGQPRPVITDAAAFQSWVTEHYPTEATAVVRLPAALLPDLLELIEVGPDPGDKIAGVPRDQVRLDLEISPAWQRRWLEALSIAGEGDDATVIDPDGQIPAGIEVAPGGAVTLSVRLSAEAKARARLEMDDPVAAGMLTAPLGSLSTAVTPAVLLDAPDDAGAEPDYADQRPMDPAAQLEQLIAFSGNDPKVIAAGVRDYREALGTMSLSQLHRVAEAVAAQPARSKAQTIARIEAGFHQLLTQE